MADVQAAAPEMFDAIYPLLAEHNPGFPEARWRRLVDYRWRGDGDLIGYVLVERGKIVGFLSTLHSRRTIHGRDTHLCNLAHWVVRREFRAESLRLLAAAVRRPNCTITCLTSSPTVGAMLGTLGFKVLDAHVQLIFPSLWFPRLTRRDRPVISSERSTIAATLDAADLKILSDHRDSACRHLILREGSRYCYLVFTEHRRRLLGFDVPYAHIHYTSARDLFRRHRARLAWYMLRSAGAAFLAIDERLAGRGLGALSRRHRLRVPRYYRSETLEPAQIDNLYTELVMGL